MTNIENIENTENTTNTFSEKDYEVVSTYKGGCFKKPILNGATLSIKGATFKIEREYTRSGEPCRTFKFISLNEFVDGDRTKELIEIGWNTSVHGLSQIGRELGLDYDNGSSLFSRGNSKPHYREVEV